MKQVGILGVGLIGGSLGMALRRIRRNGQRKYHVTGWGRSLGSLREAKRRGALDDFSLNPRSVVANSDIVAICLPVQSITNVAKKLTPFFKKGAVITDVGSVKGSFEQEMKKIFSSRKDLRFVGAHPLAGSEKSGVSHANPKLFRAATVVITDKNKSVRRLWRDVGGRCVSLNAGDHDLLLSLTSHLPHLLAFTLFLQAMGVSRKHPIIKKLGAGSFRDMTRIAGSDPGVWTGIFQMNRKAIRVSVGTFKKTLNKLLSLSPSQLTDVLRDISRAKQHWA